MKELVSLLMPIMGESVSGDNINVIIFDSVNISWAQKFPPH